jgi:hypothetical protein
MSCQTYVRFYEPKTFDAIYNFLHTIHPSCKGIIYFENSSVYVEADLVLNERGLCSETIKASGDVLSLEKYAALMVGEDPEIFHLGPCLNLNS